MTKKGKWMRKLQVLQPIFIKSGVEEPYSEKDILLQEISTLCSESDFQVKRKRPLSKEQHLSELGKKARESHAVRFYEESNDIISEIITEEFSPQKDIEIHEIDDSNKHKPEDEHNYFASEEIQIINEVAIDSEVCEENTKENTSWVQLPATEPATSIKNHDQPRVRPLGEVFQGNIQRETPKKGTILTPTGKRTYKREPMRKNALSYLSEKGQRENELRKRELDLEERKLSLEERRLALQEKKYEIEQKRMEMEVKERLHRIELERERAEAELKQKKVTSQLLESQQQLISKLISK
ncbi:unnamed protein product [Ceutorhynchus assimilis]|uniref:Uncharacterized protein n=1 Tax=Ceutorhynchus assimilis TaxID=467358 RepID=A0A9N9MNJ9_9CUCU|nr:unnamed protein product [Ceutorhynchus assimilis]